MKIEELRDIAVEFLDAEKAEDIVTINVKDKTDIADYVIICSSLNSRHSSALATKLADKFQDLGVEEIRIEGLGLCHWVLMDIGGLIIHIFKPDIRMVYNLEEIWGKDRK